MIRNLISVFAFVVGLGAAAHANGQSCTGDCNEDGAVTVDEIITGVNIALGTVELAGCLRFDGSGDQQVTVDEILQGVTVALEGCQPAPTPTVNPTPGAPSVARRAAGMITTTSQVFFAVPDLLSAMIDDLTDFSRAERARSSRHDCPDGGDRTFSCEEHLDGIPPLPEAEYELDFDDCQVEGDDGRTRIIDGRIKLTSPRGLLCGGLIPENQDFDLDIDHIVVTSTGGALDTVTTFTDINGDIAFSERDANCGFEQFNVKIDGDLLFEGEQPGGAPVSSVTGEMSDTRLRLHVDDYGSQCRPEDYSLKISGDVELTSEGVTLAADYDDYVLEADATGDGSKVRVRGGVTADCFGPKVTFVTDVDLDVAQDLACPDAGQVSVSTKDSLGIIYYSAEGIEIDRDGNGTRDESFGSCRDPELYECPL